MPISVPAVTLLAAVALQELPTVVVVLQLARLVEVDHDVLVLLGFSDHICQVIAALTYE